MALLWIDGFDDYAASTEADIKDLLDRRYKTGYSSFGDSITRAPRLDTGYALGNSSGTSFLSLTRAHLDNSDTLIIGIAIRPIYASTSEFVILELRDGEDIGMNLYVNLRTGRIIVRCGSTELGRSVGAVMRYNAWHYVEFKVKCHDSQGTAEVRVNGNTVISLSDIDTKIGPNAYHDNIFLNYTYLEYDDLYICDGTGSENNDFLGNCRVKTIFPASDAGTNNWTPSSGADHYALVDEGQENDDTDYISSNATDQVDLWGYGDVSGFQSVHGIQVNTVCRDTDTDIGSLKIVIQSDTTADDGPAQLLGNADYDVRFRVLGTDPHTSSAWTQSSVNAAHFGVKVG